MSGGSMLSFVTVVSNFPHLPTLHFSSSVRRTKATQIPVWIHKLTTLRAIQKPSWSVAFEDIGCVCCGWWGMLHCQSLLLKECMVPSIRSSRTDLGCFKMHVLAHSIYPDFLAAVTNSSFHPFFWELASLKNISVAGNIPTERIKPSAVNQLYDLLPPMLAPIAMACKLPT